MAVCRPATAFAILVACIAAHAGEPSVSLGESLYALRQSCEGADRSLAQFRRMEQNAERVVAAHPKDCGRIYAAVAEIYVQAEKKYPDQIIQYCKKSIDCGCEPLTAAGLYVDWCDAIQFAHTGAAGDALKTARREAVIPALHALKILYDDGLPEILPPDTIESLKDIDGQSPNEYEAYRRRREEQQRKIEKDREMFEIGEAASTQISFLYSRMPFATEELERLAADALKSDPAVKRLIFRVNERIKERVDALSKSELKELSKEISRPEFNAPYVKNRSALSSASDEASKSEKNSMNDPGITLTIAVWISIAVSSLALVIFIFLRRRKQ
jgi:hypothetical protein